MTFQQQEGLCHQQIDEKNHIEQQDGDQIKSRGPKTDPCCPPYFNCFMLYL